MTLFDELRAVLEPFKIIAEETIEPDDNDAADWFRHDGLCLKVGDFRVAARLHERLSSELPGDVGEMVKEARQDARDFAPTTGVKPEQTLTWRLADLIETLVRERDCAQGNADDIYAKWNEQRQRAETAEANLAKAREALEFYRDGFSLHPKRTKLGVNLSGWQPKEVLLDDCGNRAETTLKDINP